MVKIWIGGHAFGTMVFALTAAVELGDHTVSREVTEVAKRLSRIAELEVLAPAPQVVVEVLKHYRSGLEAVASSGLEADRLPRPLLGFAGRLDMEIALIAPLQVPVVAEGKAQKIQALRPPPRHSRRFFPVQRQSQPLFERAVDPAPGAFILIASENDEVLRRFH